MPPGRRDESFLKGTPERSEADASHTERWLQLRITTGTAFKATSDDAKNIAAGRNTLEAPIPRWTIQPK